MSSTPNVDGNNRFQYQVPEFKPYGPLSEARRKEIIIPLRTMTKAQADEYRYDQQVKKEEKLYALRQMHVPEYEINFLKTMDDWGEIAVDLEKRTVTIGNSDNNRTVDTYNKNGKLVKREQYFDDKKFIEEFSTGNFQYNDAYLGKVQTKNIRTYTEYQKDANGKYVKRYYVKNDENNLAGIIEAKKFDARGNLTDSVNDKTIDQQTVQDILQGIW